MDIIKTITLFTFVSTVSGFNVLAYWCIIHRLKYEAACCLTCFLSTLGINQMPYKANKLLRNISVVSKRRTRLVRPYLCQSSNKHVASVMYGYAASKAWRKR